MPVRVRSSEGLGGIRMLRTSLGLFADRTGQLLKPGWIVKLQSLKLFGASGQLCQVRSVANAREEERPLAMQRDGARRIDLELHPLAVGCKTMPRDQEQVR